MMKIKKTLLWLDDIRNPYMKYLWLINWAPEYEYNQDGNHEVIWVKSYTEFCEWISTFGIPDKIGFDHDLGTTKTGMDCVKWCSEYCMNNNELFPDYVVQSANPVGKLNMISYIENHKKHCK